MGRSSKAEELAAITDRLDAVVDTATRAASKLEFLDSMWRLNEEDREAMLKRLEGIIDRAEDMVSRLTDEAARAHQAAARFEKAIEAWESRHE